MLALLLCAGCYKGQELSHIQLVDRNGVNETISHEDRLSQLDRVNFMEAQPYQKVTRVFKRSNEGKLCSKITTYHDNGELHQYLEVMGGRAHGLYREWHDNGTLHIEATVMEGIGDITPQAQTSWLFDGMSYVWNPKGELIAEIAYEKGKLEGVSHYYQPDRIVTYKNGVLHGPSTNPDEIYEEGRLMQGPQIVNGYGVKRVVDGEDAIEYEYRKGKREGKVRHFHKGILEREYTVIDGEKLGEERFYDEDGNVRLCAEWQGDVLTGTVRTWYANGKKESEKEMVDNKKQGHLFVWYDDGSLMMAETYEKDCLVEGKYLKRGDDLPTSRVIQGSGTAHIFDGEGNLVKKVHYIKGEPSD